MSTAIAVTKQADFSGFRIEQGPRGHLMSPWFSWNWKRECIAGPADIRSGFHKLIRASQEAFASAIGMPESALNHGMLVVTQKEEPATGETWWRLSTTYPMDLPKPAKPEKPVLPENRGAIDI